MLQSKLRTALSPLFTARGGAIVSRPEKLLLLNRIGSVQHSLHYCTEEEDDFAELGSPMEQDRVATRRLLTEKPERVSSAAKSIKRLRVAYLKSGDSASAPQSRAVKSTHISDSNIVKRTAYDFESSKSVTIENVPSIIQLLVLEKVMLDFGKVSNILKRTVPNRLDCCDVEFESAESRSRALSVGRIDVMNFNLPIHPLCPPDVVGGVRLSDVSPVTTDSALHSALGPLDEIVRKDDDAVVGVRICDISPVTTDSALDSALGPFDEIIRKDEDVVVADSRYISEKLNKTVMDKHNRSAHLQTSDSTTTGVTSDDNSLLDLGLKVNTQIEDLKQRIAFVKIDIEDLELLHQSIMHMQHHPLTGTDPSH